jgi:VIT1/CCC1 family predicted Fe2+/Mn2+ transporter/rubrerythrin
MDELTDRERDALLGTAKRILAYKRMQAKGYKRLARKAKDERVRQLLLDISHYEAEDSEEWSERLDRLGGRREGFAESFLMDSRVNLMMRVLGRRGFLEWAIIAEDESIEALAVQAATVRDTPTSEAWTRITSDERAHVERTKNEILGMEAWEMRESGGVRDVIFGANDGLVSILALVVGVYGAATVGHTVLIAGVAGAVAGAISMGAGAYLSSKSEREVLERESERKGIRRKGSPEEERSELVGFYRAKGFKVGEAEALADRAISTMTSRSELTMGEEVGLTAEESWPPVKAGILTGLSFAVASLIPVLPFAFLAVSVAVGTATAASIASLFAVGASKAIFTRKSWIRSGLEMMTIGGLAAAATYVIGLVIPE